MQTLGEKIKNLRERKGMTVEELAKKAGVCRLTIIRAEKKNHRLKTTTVKEIAVALGTTADALYNAEISKLEELSGDVSAEEATLGHKIAELRCEKGLERSDLAKLANVSYATIYNIEEDYRPVKKSTILKVAKALGKTMEEVYSAK